MLVTIYTLCLALTIIELDFVAMITADRSKSIGYVHPTPLNIMQGMVLVVVIYAFNRLCILYSINKL